MVYNDHVLVLICVIRLIDVSLNLVNSLETDLAALQGPQVTSLQDDGF